nr:LysR family transcriptional regulator [uncultured Flavonifractor sp.]
MKIQTLEYLLTLAESHSINEAAQKLYISQPSLTKALQLFEKEIGVQLFLRTKAGIQLTETGRSILPEIRQVVSYYHHWLSLSNQRTPQVIDVFIQASFPNFLLPEVILEFKKQHPDIQINCEITATPEQHISQNAQRPTLALFVCPRGASARAFAKEQGNPPLVLFQGEYCCLVNRRSRLAGRTFITPEDLREYYLALRSHLDAPALCLAPTLDVLVPVVSPAQVMHMESVDSIINLVHTHEEVYALSYYPILRRYEGVLSGELTYIPFEEEYAKGDFCLFYSQQACQEYPVLQELVLSIQDAAARFLSETE